ncbi:MAG TPA: M4 family metallopeptidase [Archangium sp.]|nr:M4 family metallopeptidase [Archangium sp.]
MNEEALRAGEKDVDIQASLARFKDVRVVSREADVPTMVTGKLGRLPAAGTVGELRAKQALRETVEALAPVFRVNGEELTFKRVSKDSRGHQFMRFQQVRNGLEVVGGEMLLHADRDGNVYAANGSLREVQGAASHARVAAEAAERMAVEGSGARTAQGSARLVYFKPEGDTLRLAYEVRVTGERADGMPVDELVYVNAEDGRTLASHSRIHTAQNRAVYSANNGTSLPGTLKRSEGGAATSDTHVDDNYGHLGTTYQCYFQNFGRDSYDNAGAQLKSTVHYSTNYTNAFWNGTQMVYGDSNGTDAGPLGKSLDVTVHELTHAVTDYESDLVYSNESGALNEGMSDIFSAYCEAWTKGWATDAAVYMIGDDIWTPNTPGDALRYMGNPTQDGSSKDYYPERYTGSSDNGGVHWNSGIANLAFKLLSEGGTHPRGKTTVTVPGIGIQKAGKIFYEANANCMTSSSNFAAAKTCTEQKAEQFYSAVEKDAVTKAWEAVGVGIVVPPPASTPLSNGVAVTSLSDSAGGNKYYKLEVPAGQASLKFDTTGGTGDMDMYVKFGAAPDMSSYDCRPYATGNTENCSFTNPAAGTWYVMLNAYSAYSGLSLTGLYSADSGGGGTPVTTTVSGSVASGQNVTYPAYSVVAGTKFKVVMSGTGDPDLYVRFGAAPTTSTYNCRPYLSGAAETCDVTVPAGQSSAYIMVRGYTAASYTLNISYTRP